MISMSFITVMTGFYAMNLRNGWPQPNGWQHSMGVYYAVSALCKIDCTRITASTFCRVALSHTCDCSPSFSEGVQFRSAAMSQVNFSSIAAAILSFTGFLYYCYTRKLVRLSMLW